MILTGAPGHPPRRVSAPESVLTLLRDLVHERTGIFFENSRLDSMADKLEPRALAHGCQSYLDYYYVLKYDDHGAAEWRRVMDAFSVQETYFWREFDQVRVLVDEVVPNWFRRTQEPLRIWSAACATGEEPYSIAIALREAGWGSHPIEIIASDASESALARARSRIYRERSFRSLPLALRERYFTARSEGFELNADIASRVTFHWANLLKLDEFTVTAAVHVIFCRNVFIYFSVTSIAQVLAVFAQRLPAGAPLFVAASESLLKITTEFELREVQGAFMYVRTSPA